MGLQTYFKDFNKNIKMDYDVLSELADKRDILLKKLRADEDLPSFEKLDQGSYSMCTGVESLNRDYDIDVGLRFNVNKDEYEPVELKEKVCDILKNHTEYGAEIRQPCVTVKYKKDGELAYHVDLVVYAYEDKDDADSKLYLARGKKYSSAENKYWEEAHPKKLTDTIIEKYSDSEDREQYRRIIRYMKRWKNLKFISDKNGEPPGIGITLLAYEKFNPSKTYDYLEEKYNCNDLDALINFVKQIKNTFLTKEYSIEKKEWLYKIEVNLPVIPYSNVFSKMSDIQVTEFKKKIDKLVDALDEVKTESDIVEQCTKLNKIFGDDFKIPAKENESKTQKNYVPPSSASGKGI